MCAAGNEIRGRRKPLKPDLLARVRQDFRDIPDAAQDGLPGQTDCLMRCLAAFSLKQPLLLPLDEDPLPRSPVTSSNLKTLFGVTETSSGPALCERLDRVDPQCLRPAFGSVFEEVQRREGLDAMRCLDGRCLISIQRTESQSRGTGGRSRTNRGRDGRTKDDRQYLVAALTNPDRSGMLPLAPEPIRRSDGATANEREWVASMRLLDDFRRNHPDLRTVFTAEGLRSSVSLIRKMKELDARYVLPLKRDDPMSPVLTLDSSADTQTLAVEDAEARTRREFRWLSDVDRNWFDSGLGVNLLECQERREGRKAQLFLWATDLSLERDTVMSVMRAGRANWRVDRDSLRTMNEQDLSESWNSGRGNSYLPDILVSMMFLAMSIDQAELLCCDLLRKARLETGQTKYFWRRIRDYFGAYQMDDWETFYRLMARELGVKHADFVELS